MKIDLEKLDRMVREGLVSKQTHPEADLHIYNYTPACVYARAWNDITLLTRGLILDGEGNIVERPFEKFFNVEDHSRSDLIFKEPFQAYEKMDGSMGVLYFVGDLPAVATRGSFKSDQAQWATEHLRNTHRGWTPDRDHTYLFEIIYPANRIVVDYGGFEGLVFLAAIHKETGHSVFRFGDERDFPGVHVKRFDSEHLSPLDLLELERPNEEGFVLFFPNSNKRMKAKLAEYVRVHRIVTGTNTKRIWAWLAEGKTTEEYLENVPDEFFDFVTQTVEKLSSEHEAICGQAYADYDAICQKLGHNFKRKDFALAALKYRNNSLLFKIHDGKSIEDMVWQMVKPERAEFYASYDEEA